MKECDILGVITYSDPHNIFRGSRSLTSRIYAPESGQIIYLLLNILCHLMTINFPQICTFSIQLFIYIIAVLKCTLVICDCLNSQPVFRTPSPCVRFTPILRLRSTPNSRPVTPRCVNPRRTLTPQPRADVAYEPVQLSASQRWSESPNSLASSGRTSVLDELPSWRKLKEPLQRYLKFVQCNYFGADDPLRNTAPLEDNSSSRTVSTDDVHSSGCTAAAAAGEMQQDDDRLLQRPRAEPHRLASSCKLSEQR